MNYDRSVFINCPFDEAYSPLLRAIVFALLDCGFHPRCALESPDASETRILRIYRIIGECGLGIHDLSRNQFSLKVPLPRFNMPLELGIFLGAKFIGREEQQKKACLIFDEHPYLYQKYLSDVAGQDISWHGNDPRNVVICIRNWLGSLVQEHIPSGSIVWDRYRTFQGELRQTCIELRQKPEELTYTDTYRHIMAFRDGYFEELELVGVRKIPNPSSYDIRQAINSIDLTDPDPVILQKGKNGHTYIQAVAHSKSGWFVEYQEGDLDRHFKALTDVNTEEVIRLFISYSQADDWWRSAFEWGLIEV